MKRSAAVVVLVLLLDQCLKVWIKTNMYLGQEYKIFGDWFIVHFTENNGMAFGMEFGGEIGKLLLTLFRIVAVCGIGYYLNKLIREKANSVFILSITLIFAGAIGNIIDSTFYGVLFSSSTYELARFLPENGGYSSFLQGKVVDMLYFPVLKGMFPEWLPIVGGDYFEFFRPVFNIADASISIGVGTLIYVQVFMQKKLMLDGSSTVETDADLAEDRINSEG